MATPAQIAANRRNAQLSTGPRTSEGRARVALNPTRHSLFDTRDFIPPEEIDLSNEVASQLRRELAPETLPEGCRHPRRWPLPGISAAAPFSTREFDRLADPGQEKLQ